MLCQGHAYMLHNAIYVHQHTQVYIDAWKLFLHYLTINARLMKRYLAHIKNYNNICKVLNMLL